MERIAIYYTDDELQEHITYVEDEDKIYSKAFYLSQKNKIVKICKETLDIVKTEDLSLSQQFHMNMWIDRFIKVKLNNKIHYFHNEQKAIDFYKSNDNTILSHLKLNVNHNPYWNYNYYYFDEEERLKQYNHNINLYKDSNVLITKSILI